MNMNEILPAIIAKDFEELKEKFKQVEGLVSWVQIDVMDGVFVPPVTWYEPKDLKKIKTNFKKEVHLMVQNPEVKTQEWIESRVDRILIHYESAPYLNILKMIEDLKSAEIEVGLVLKMETELSDVEDLLNKVDVVQLMSIDEIGYYGKAFDARVIPKITTLKEMNTNVKVEVDGGVNIESAKELLRVGVDRLSVGSTIFKSDNIEKTILKLQNL